MTNPTEPLETFATHFLHADWDEDYEDLHATVAAFLDNATAEEVLALRNAINAALMEHPRGTEWPVDLWPFDEEDAPPHEILPAILDALSGRR